MSEPMQSLPVERPRHGGHWALGLALGVGVNLLTAGLLALLAMATGGGWEAVMLTPGLTQLVGVLPLTFFLLRSGRTRTAWGLLVTAGIVFLLNGACWGMLVVGLSQM